MMPVGNFLYRLHDSLKSRTIFMVFDIYRWKKENKATIFILLREVPK